MGYIKLKNQSMLFFVNSIQKKEKDTYYDRCFHKNDTKFEWKSKNIVDNYVEIGDFSKSFIHKCHFWKFEICEKLSENLKKNWIGQ